MNSLHRDQDRWLYFGGYPGAVPLVESYMIHMY